MPSTKEPVTLHGSKAERFREIKTALEEERGYQPTNPEVVGFLMGEVNL